MTVSLRVLKKMSKAIHFVTQMVTKCPDSVNGVSPPTSNLRLIAWANGHDVREDR